MHNPISNYDRKIIENNKQTTKKGKDFNFGSHKIWKPDFKPQNQYDHQKRVDCFYMVRHLSKKRLYSADYL